MSNKRLVLTRRGCESERKPEKLSPVLARAVLCSVFRVDLYIAVAQIAGEGAGRSLTDVQHQRHLVFTLADHRMQGRRLGFVQGQRAAAFQDFHIAEVKVGVFGHHVTTATACTAEDTAPVGVFAEHGALGQVRCSDEAGHAESFFVAFGFFDAQFDKLGSAFAVTHDILREALHDKHEGRTELALFGKAQVFVAQSAHAVGQQDAGVVGAGVAGLIRTANKSNDAVVASSQSLSAQIHSGENTLAAYSFAN